MDQGLTFIPIVAAPFVGSFLATVAYRVPAGISFASGRSACLACKQALTPRSLVPILSWLVQRGRCRHCDGRISSFYPAVEIAALATALWAASVVPGVVPMALSCVLGWALLALSAIDIRDGVLPDLLTIPLVFAGLAAVAWVEPGALGEHVLAAAMACLGAWLIGESYRMVRGRAGLGTGDIKLIAAAGAWVGPAGLPGVLMIATCGALIFAIGYGAMTRRLAGDLRIPFGPFLAVGIWLVWLYGPLVLRGPFP